jgi:hypothetical protein
MNLRKKQRRDPEQSDVLLGFQNTEHIHLIPIIRRTNRKWGSSSFPFRTPTLPPTMPLLPAEQLTPAV